MWAGIRMMVSYLLFVCNMFYGAICPFTLETVVAIFSYILVLFHKTTQRDVPEIRTVFSFPWVPQTSEVQRPEVDLTG
jgi:hypothetical protein